MEGLEVGVKYRIDLDSLKEFMVMQYDFKPASVDAAARGELLVEDRVATLKLTKSQSSTTPPSSSSSTTTTTMTSVVENNDSVDLKGFHYPYPSTERILVLDGTDNSLSLHRINRSISGLRHQRKEVGTSPAKAAKLATAKQLKKRISSKRAKNSKKTTSEKDMEKGNDECTDKVDNQDGEVRDMSA